MASSDEHDDIEFSVPLYPPSSPDTQVSQVNADICEDETSVAETSPIMHELVPPLNVNTDVIVLLIQHCDFHLLAAWRATCHAFFAVVAAHMRSRYELCIRRFVDNVPMFDELLKDHGAVVSGSVALWFFLTEEAWLPKDLDIYVPDNTYDRFVMAATDPDGLNLTLFPSSRPWMCVGDEMSDDEDDAAAEDEQAMALDPVNGGEFPEATTPSMSAGVLEVRQFYTANGRRVDIIRGPGLNPTIAINRFWASLVMNFLRPDGCVCGYPRTTLRRIGMLSYDLTRRDFKAVRKYLKRDFMLVQEEWRRGADAFDALFFGRRRALVYPFRVELKMKGPKLPVIWTDRGWMIDTKWTSGLGKSVLLWATAIAIDY